MTIDKPSGWTSHDVVARMRRLAGTRRVGHCGTLDPMATGVLVVGIGRATRLLGHISAADKHYTATVRLGWGTVTDDAHGDRIGGAAADGLAPASVMSAVGDLTGPILQRPSAVSAIKVAGTRSHARVRAGEDVELPARAVQITEFDVRDIRPLREFACLDVDISVTCSSGTYIRALARDLGQALGVGGHLTALRRTRVGVFEVNGARTLEQAEQHLELMDLATVAKLAFRAVGVTDADALAVRHGRPIHLGIEGSPSGLVAATLGSDAPTGEESPVQALFAPDGEFLALARRGADGRTRYLAVFSQP